MKQLFIDRFTIPFAAKQEFLKRTNLSRDFIKTLPGFIKDTAYQSEDDKGNFVCMTIAEWESEEVMRQAKLAVQAEYKQQGFNPAEFIERLNITMKREVFTEMD